MELKELGEVEELGEVDGPETDCCGIVSVLPNVPAPRFTSKLRGRADTRWADNIMP